MDIAAELQTTLESLVSALKDAAANPKPSYSVDGVSVQWSDYMSMLKTGIKEVSELIGTFDPVEHRSVVL